MAGSAQKFPLLPYFAQTDLFLSYQNFVFRVTLSFTSLFDWQELGQEQLANIEHREAFEAGLATHVVTKIQTGCDGYFVFDKKKSTSKCSGLAVPVSFNVDVGDGSLKDILKPLAHVSAGAEVCREWSNCSFQNQLKCKYHGDAVLSQTIESYADAVLAKKVRCYDSAVISMSVQ